MRIACPSCETAYEVPESVVTAGRRMRCAHCHTEFVPDAAPAPVAASPEAEPEQPVPPPIFSTPPLPVVAPGEGERMASIRAPNPAETAPAIRGAVLAGWAMSVAVLLVAGWLAVVWRHPIEHAWPASGWLYIALGYK